MDRVRSKGSVSEPITTVKSQSAIIDYNLDPDGDWDVNIQKEALPSVPASYQSYNASGSSQVMTDVSSPSFKKDQANGQIIMNDMTSRKETFNDSGCSYNVALQPVMVGNVRRELSVYGTAGVKELTRFNSQLFPDLDMDIAVLQAKAISQAHGRISLSKMQLLATLGEGKETVNSVVNLLHDAIAIFRAVRRLDFKYLKGELSPRHWADRYMEFRYALRPLYYDGHQLLEALQAERPKKMRQTFRGKSTDSYQDSSPQWVPLWSDTAGVANIRCEHNRTVNVEVTAGVLTDVKFMGNTHIFGLSEIAESAWELMPFSFIIDWFTNLGLLISSWAPNPGFTVLGSWVTTKVMTEYDSYPTEIANFTSYYDSVVGTFSGTYSEIIEEVTRKANPSKPFLPHFDVNLDFLKILDLTVILRGLKSM